MSVLRAQFTDPGEATGSPDHSAPSFGPPSRAVPFRGRPPRPKPYPDICVPVGRFALRRVIVARLLVRFGLLALADATLLRSVAARRKPETEGRRRIRVIAAALNERHPHGAGRRVA